MVWSGADSPGADPTSMPGEASEAGPRGLGQRGAVDSGAARPFWSSRLDRDERPWCPSSHRCKVGGATLVICAGVGAPPRGRRHPAERPFLRRPPPPDPVHAGVGSTSRASHHGAEGHRPGRWGMSASTGACGCSVGSRRAGWGLAAIVSRGGAPGSRPRAVDPPPRNRHPATATPQPPPRPELIAITVEMDRERLVGRGGGAHGDRGRSR
jgi:hypothetical protein